MIRIDADAILAHIFVHSILLIIAAILAPALYST